MLPSPSNQFVVVGNPGSRRVELFADAVRAAGLSSPRVVAWMDVLRGDVSFEQDDIVRIDSPGEDSAVDFALRGVTDSTRVEGTATWYRRFVAAAGKVAAAARSVGARLLDDPNDIATLFDKRLCHRRLREAGVAVPEALDAPIQGWTDLREQLSAARMPRAFVKLAHGSSASGVVALELGEQGRMRATTSVEITLAGAMFNSLRVRRYETEREIARIIDALAPDGLHVERWVPKASQNGRAADLRVVVVDGSATHAVVRTSKHPMTNLHLGGTRGNLDDARAVIERGGGRWSEVLELGEAAAECFPRTHCVGVDVLPGTGWRRFTVGEVNAFGDLLPGLSGLSGSGAERFDTYGAQVAAALRKDSSSACA